MGLLGWLNRHGNQILDPEIVDPAFKRADRALEQGAGAGATLVGIEQKLDDGTTTRFVAVAVPTAAGTRTAGVHVMRGPAHLLARFAPGRGGPRAPQRSERGGARLAGHVRALG